MWPGTIHILEPKLTRMWKAEKPLPATQSVILWTELYFLMCCYLCWSETASQAWLFSIGAEGWHPHILKSFLCLAWPCLSWHQISPTRASWCLQDQSYDQSFYPKLDCSRADPSPPVCFFSVLLRSDLANPEKGEFRPKYSLLPLVKKRIKELMVRENI